MMRTVQILWAFGRRNLFWRLSRDLSRRHLGHADCDCEADRRVEQGATRLREALEELGPTTSGTLRTACTALPLEDVLEDFEGVPVAAASLAQVHRARFPGQPVAVKILRPGVLDRINTDLGVIRRVRGLLMRGLGLAGTVDTRQFFEEFRRRLQTEVDLAAEALNIDRFRANRDPNGRVTAPTPPAAGTSLSAGGPIVDGRS